MFSSRATEFDELADVCLERADEASNRDDVALWFAMALEWMRLAADARNLSAGHPLGIGR